MSKQTLGLLAAIAASLALLITLPFTLAYFLAYDDPTAWMWELIHNSGPLLKFDSRSVVYATYGKLYSTLLPLTAPAFFYLDRNFGPGRDSRSALWGYRLLVGGMFLGALGIIGDYWPAQDSWWIGAGFMAEMIGILLIWIGSLLYGRTLQKTDGLGKRIGLGWMLVPAGGILGLTVLGHIPSGPLLGYAGFWLVIGMRLLTPGALLENSGPISRP
ncbi:MAG TPA: hypothetical protein VMN57_14500 [Anaerolineales bacterium]|nr:hypothetical protein [Anaerolineales bacterium]